MLSFKQFVESLNIVQKSVVDKWLPDKASGRIYSPKAEQISSHIMPEGQHAMVIPAIAHTMREVHAHLDSNGYTGHDYAAGTTTDKHGRTVSMGGALTKSKAPQSLINDFANDDREGAIDLEKHDVIISRHPYHVAEASTNKPFKSCAALTPSGKPCRYGNGAAAKRLPNEIKEGTHVAYLVPKLKKGEQESLAFPDIQSRIDNTTARIYLKPHHSETSGHTVLIPEDKVYQKKDKKNLGFLRTVQKFASDNFPMRNGELYRKNRNVYDDDKSVDTPKFNSSDESIDTIMSGDDPHMKRELRTSELLNRDQLHKLIDHHDDPVHDVDAMQQLAHNPNLEKSHIDKLISRGVISVNNILAANHKLDRKHIDSFVKSNDNSTHFALATQNKNKLSPEHIHAIIDQALRDQDSKKEKLKRSSSEKLHNVLGGNPSHFTLRGIMNNPNINSSHVDKILQSDDPVLHTKLLDDHSSKLSDDQVKAIHDKWKGQDLSHLNRWNNPYNTAKMRLQSRNIEGV